jgi:hypothetical protein
MARWLNGLVLCACISVLPAAASQPGERLTSGDVVFTIFGMTASTFIAVDPEFDYSTCSQYPTPADLRCDLLAQGGFDAEGLQYAVRHAHSALNPLLSRSEIWRTRPDGSTEMMAFLEPRQGVGAAFDDGRIDRIAVDPVNGTLWAVLSTSCFPAGSPTCFYARPANEIVRITGLKTLRDVLLTGDAPPPAGGGSKLPVGQTVFSSSESDDVARPGDSGGVR